ncbi:MAG TPA: MHYT domain-containing protein [Gemmatimonadaceae bacterium]|nr:MHYT domain-containing protein [Gemmatimonadaceae bacterium]
MGHGSDLHASYDATLIVASILIATLAGYTALTLTARVSAADTARRRVAWLIAGAVSMGVGIWGMHFIGMLALFLPVPVTYGATAVIASVAVACVASALALSVAARAALRMRRLTIAGLALGGAIVGMHYTGMAAVRFAGVVHYDAWRVVCSIVVAVAVAIAALWIAFQFRDEAVNARRSVAQVRKWGASIVMGCAVAGMHYTAMWAAHFHSDPTRAAAAVDPDALPRSEMALLVAAVTLGILGAAVAAARVGRALAHEAELQQAVAERTAHLKAALEEVRAGEALFQQLSNASTDGVAIACGGIVLETNRAWRLMFGYDAGARGVSVLELIAPEDVPTISASLANTREGREEVEIMCRRRDMTVFEAVVTVHECRWSAEQAQVVVIRDVSAMRRMERLKNELVSTVSHELRTPLTAMRGAFGLLERSLGAQASSESRHLIRIGRTNCDRLTRLINDLLDLDKIKAGRLELRTQLLVLPDLVRSTIDALRPMAEEYGVSLAAETEDRLPCVHGDLDRLTQVLSNLVTNAIKFTPRGATITIRTAPVRWLSIDEWLAAGRAHPMGAFDAVPTDAGVRVTVENPGPGIAPADIPRLFQRFQQLDGSDTRARGGTGLGLAITKAIVERHGGSIGVESEPNVSTRFWFELPGMALLPVEV